jgi:hypothetical protein
VSYSARFGDIIDVPPGPAGDTALGLIPPTDVELEGDWVIAAQYIEPQGFAFRYRVPQRPFSQYYNGNDNRAPAELELVFGRDAARFVQRVAVPVVGLMMRVPSRPSSIRVRRRKDTTGAGFQSGTPTPFRLSVGLLPYAPSDVRYSLTLPSPSVVQGGPGPEPVPTLQTFPVELPRFSRTLVTLDRTSRRQIIQTAIPAASFVDVNLGTSCAAGRLYRTGTFSGITLDVRNLLGQTISFGAWAPNAWLELPPESVLLRISNSGAGAANVYGIYEPSETAFWVDAERLNRWPVDAAGVPELADAIEATTDPVIDRGIEAVA